MKGQTNHMLLERRIPQTLRNNTTDVETRLWQRLRGRQLAGCKFRRQHPYLDYVLDFVCLEKHLIVEVDGGQHLESERDKIRDRRLQDAGFKILRFWNNEVLEDIGAVVEAIWGALEPHPHPNPPLEGEGASGGFCSGLEGEGASGGFCSGLEGEGASGGFCSGLEGEGASGGFCSGLEGEGVSGGCCSGLEGEGVLGGYCSDLEGEGVLGGCCSGLEGEGVHRTHYRCVSH